MPVRVKKMRENKNLEPRFDSIKSGKALEHFQAKRMPVRVKKMRENKNLEPRFDSIKSGKALAKETPMGKHARTPEAREARIALIKAAALDHFAQKGFAAARLEDIAADAGIAKGTIYLYFNSKENLLESLVASTIGATLETMAKTIAASPAPASQLLRMLGETLAVASQDPDRRRVMHLVFSEGARFPAVAQFYHREVIARGTALVRGIIARGRASGEFVHDEPERFPQLVVAPALIAAVWAQVFDPFEKLDGPGLIAAHFDLLLRALTRADT
jgi:AcrR family transcriptional regulator